jgi:hypothetical protein
MEQMLGWERETKGLRVDQIENLSGIDAFRFINGDRFARWHFDLLDLLLLMGHDLVLFFGDRLHSWWLLGFDLNRFFWRLISLFNFEDL